MAKIKFPQLPQFAGIFTRLGHREDYKWVPLPWDGVFNKALMFNRCTLEFIEKFKGENFIS